MSILETEWESFLILKDANFDFALQVIMKIPAQLGRRPQ